MHQELLDNYYGYDEPVRETLENANSFKVLEPTMHPFIFEFMGQPGRMISRRRIVPSKETEHLKPTSVAGPVHSM